MADVTVVARNAYSGLDADKPTTANVGDTYDATDTFKRYSWNGSGWNIQDVFASRLLHIRDEKADGVNGGTFTQAVWQTRVLQTVKTNEIAGASLAANQITLPAGTYFCIAEATAFEVNNNKAKLRNITDGADVIIGLNSYAGVAGADMDAALVSGRFTIADTKVLELQHRCLTTQAANGFGFAVSFGVIEVYADIKIWRIE